MGFLAKIIDKVGLSLKVSDLSLFRNFPAIPSLLQTLLENHLMARCGHGFCGVEHTRAPAEEGAEKRGPSAAMRRSGMYLRGLGVTRKNLDAH